MPNSPQNINRGQTPLWKNMLGGCCTVTYSGAERRDKVLDEISTAFHGGAAAVQKGDTLPPQKTPISQA